jgi:hypothetical protein
MDFSLRVDVNQAANIWIMYCFDHLTVRSLWINRSFDCCDYRQPVVDEIRKGQSSKLTAV